MKTSFNDLSVSWPPGVEVHMKEAFVKYGWWMFQINHNYVSQKFYIVYLDDYVPTHLIIKNAAFWGMVRLIFKNYTGISVPLQ